MRKLQRVGMGLCTLSWALSCVVMGLMFGATNAQAAELPAQGRLFAGVTSADPASFNQELTVNGFKEQKLYNRFGVEITMPIGWMLEAGLRYTKTYHNIDEISPTPGSSYGALVDQDSVMGIARVPVFKSPLVRADVFAGIGGSNTTLKFKNASLDGDLSRREGSDWFASIRSTAGVSVGVGFKNVFFVVEGGFDSNKVDSLNTSGTLNAGLVGNVTSIDLSGSYITVGLMFDGITATSK